VRWASRRRLARRRQLVEQNTDGRPRPGCCGNTVPHSGHPGMPSRCHNQHRQGTGNCEGRSSITVSRAVLGAIPGRVRRRRQGCVAASGLGIFGPHRTGDYPSAHAQSRITLSGRDGSRGARMDLFGDHPWPDNVRAPGLW
jgi:hypothetical protein